MRFIDKLQYITLFFLSFIIIGAASVITGDIGLNLFKEPSFYLNQLLTYAAIMCVTFAVLYAYLDKFKETDEEYLANMTYIKDFALSKNNVPSILSRFLEKTNRHRKIKQFEHNIKKALFKLDNEKKYKWFGPNKYFTEEDLYIWNHGTLEEKKAYVTSRTGIDINTINEMTYRYFDLVYSSSVNNDLYFAQKMVQCSYKYDVKEDVRHPLFEPPKDPYAEIFEDTGILGEKGISGADKLNAQNAQMMLEN